MIISACHRSSGKTTITIALSFLLKKMGFGVQTFKKGPDFIDPMWLSASSGKPCYNLDIFMMGEENTKSSFKKRSSDADIVIIEGNKGLYDSMDTEGKDSTANLSKILKAPVVLVVDASRMNRGIAPLILGYQRFEDVEIAGVILNKIANPRHEEKLKNSLRNYCQIEVLGAIPKKENMVIKEAHHGLVPPMYVEKKISRISNVVNEHVDLKRIISIGKKGIKKTSSKTTPKKRKVVKLAIAKDSAFCFYYPDNIEALEENGAEITFFSPLYDNSLPPCDALYLGGGFPELSIEQLRKNKIAKEISSLIEEGMPVYAECGGLIYLVLIGAIKGKLLLYKKPIGHGYVILKTRNENKWFKQGYIRGHEFHYLEIKDIEGVDFGYDVIYGKGIDGKMDGAIYKNVLASYTHIHHLSFPKWAENFIKKAID